jgi:hypothetical protein
MKSCKLYLYSVFLFAIFDEGCRFHYIENPGSQISSSIKVSKENSVFINAYKPNLDSINGILIDTVFAEKKYSSDGGFFSNYRIDSDKLQLIIVTHDYLVRDGKGFGVDWIIQGFNPYSGKITYRDYKQRELPDSMVMEVDSMNNGHLTHIIGKLTLYKIK